MASMNGTDNLFLSISLQIAVVGGYIEKAKHRKNNKNSLEVSRSIKQLLIRIICCHLKHIPFSNKSLNTRHSG